MVELLNYDTSWLNPVLKFVIIGLYIVVAYVYYRAKKTYAGDIEKVLGTLFWMSTVAGVAALLRYFGHGTDFGFTSAYSLKWIQSLGYVFQAALFVFVAWQLSRGIIPEIRDINE
jgi:hypothetical protein